MAAGAAAAAATALTPCIELSNGVRLPRIGLGTFRARGAEATAAVQCALELGLRHIDTASVYKNEVEIGRALAASGIPREQLFVTSKVSPYEQGSEKARKACDAILERLGTYVDLMLIHWPGIARTPHDSPLNARGRQETWRVLEEYQRQGRFRALGVSNYTVAHLQELLSYAEVPPVANQVECHPHCPQHDLRAFCSQHGIALIAYSPLGTGQLLSEPRVVAAAAASGLTPAQVLLRWGLQHGLAVIPKSVQQAHIRQFDPERLRSTPLGLEQMVALDALAAEQEGGERRYCWDPRSIM